MFLVSPAGWLINTRTPEVSTQLPGFEGHTVHYVFPIPERGLMLLGHSCGIYCYDSTGLRWEQCEGLFCCDDPILDVEGDTLVLLAHSHAPGEDMGGKPTRKTVDLATGVRTDKRQ